MNGILILGIIAATTLIVGAAWTHNKWKNVLFAIGNVGMFIYALLNYQDGGPVFFVFLESLIMVSTVLMLSKVKDFWNALIVCASGLGFVLWSLYLFEDYRTVIFIFGLTILGLGFAFRNGTVRRELALLIGSVILGVFSYLEVSWLFVYVNVFFAIFSFYHLTKMLHGK